jgi:hypothetical protein
MDAGSSYGIATHSCANAGYPSATLRLRLIKIAARVTDFWTIVAMFVIGGLNAIMQVIPPALQTVVMGILSIGAVYFHVNPSQTYNPPSST